MNTKILTYHFRSKLDPLETYDLEVLYEKLGTNLGTRIFRLAGSPRF